MKTGLILFLLILFSLTACQNEDEDYTFFFDRAQDFKLYNKYTSLDEALAITLTKVNDSRCPEGVTCVWQGEARVHIALENADTFSLSTYDDLKDTIDGFSFELLEVSPYPEIENPLEQEDYVISLRISEVK